MAEGRSVHAVLEGARSAAAGRGCRVQGVPCACVQCTHMCCRVLAPSARRHTGIACSCGTCPAAWEGLAGSGCPCLHKASPVACDLAGGANHAAGCCTRKVYSAQSAAPLERQGRHGHAHTRTRVYTRKASQTVPCLLIGSQRALVLGHSGVLQLRLWVRALLRGRGRRCATGS